MAQPAEYNRRKDFTDQDGDDTDHNALNQEFDAAAQSINEIRSNLAIIQKDDGSLANQSVGSDQLQPGVFDAYQGELNQKVQEAKDASTQATFSAVASAESAENAAISEENAARSESNAAASAGSAASAAQYAFNGIYFGPHGDDPALDPNGNPPTDGDFYYNTVAKTWRAYDAETGRWVAPILSGQFKRQIYEATTDYAPGVTDELTLPGDPQTVRNIFVHFDGIFQQANTFTLDGLLLKFDAPIPFGVQQVEIAYIEAVTIVVTDALMSFATRAEAASALADAVDGQAYEIRADESAAGVLTRGVVMSGVLVDQPIGVQSINGGQIAGMRNKIINGKMEIAQRGTSFVNPVSGSYLTDRFAIGSLSSSAQVTITQAADAPASNEFQSSLRVTVTTADASVAAGAAVFLQQIIEGFNVRDLTGRTFTLSFWVRSSKTGVHCVSFFNSTADRSWVAEYTVNAANTWEFKTVTVSGGMITAGTWNYTNGMGLTARWNLAAGSSFNGTPGTWQTSPLFSTANQVNCLDAVGNIFAITGVQLEVGEVATPFEHRPYGMELSLCQRYFWQGLPCGALNWIGAGSPSWPIKWPVTMRATPTITQSFSASAILAASTPTAADFANNAGTRFILTSTGSGSITFGLGDFIAASAEL